MALPTGREVGRGESARLHGDTLVGVIERRHAAARKSRAESVRVECAFVSLGAGRGAAGRDPRSRLWKSPPKRRGVAAFQQRSGPACGTDSNGASSKKERTERAGEHYIITCRIDLMTLRVLLIRSFSSRRITRRPMTDDGPLGAAVRAICLAPRSKGPDSGLLRAFFRIAAPFIVGICRPGAFLFVLSLRLSISLPLSLPVRPFVNRTPRRPLKAMIYRARRSGRALESPGPFLSAARQIDSAGRRDGNTRVQTARDTVQTSARVTNGAMLVRRSVEPPRNGPTPRFLLKLRNVEVRREPAPFRIPAGCMTRRHHGIIIIIVGGDRASSNEPGARRSGRMVAGADFIIALSRRVRATRKRKETKGKEKMK